MKIENDPLDKPFTPAHAPAPPSWLRVVQIIGWAGEGLCVFFVLAGGLFKLESWEYGSEFLVIGISSLMMWYLIMLWAIAGSRTWLHGLLTVPIAFALMFGLCARLFRWMSWPGAQEMAIMGFPILIIGLFVTGVVFASRFSQTSNQQYYQHLLVRMFVMTLLTAPVFVSAFR